MLKILLVSNATVVAVSGSVSIGSSTGVGAAIGAAVANNYIGYYQDSSRHPSEVQAYIQNSSVKASGDLTLNALADEDIVARVGAGSVAVAASTGGTGLSGSGSGVFTFNKIATLVKAFVNGDGATGIEAKSATFTATDTSKIKADAGAASIAIAAASTTGGSLSIGVALASNLISNEVEAFVNNADNSFKTTIGGIGLSATSNPTIEALSIAASLAVGAAGTTGVGISGAGAAAINTILTKTNAYIKDSVVTSAGAVSLTATNTATISAKIAAVSLAVGAAGTTGVGVSIGAAVANNYIGYDGDTRQPVEVQAYIQNSSLITNEDLTLTAFSGGSITAGVGAGSAAVAGGGTTGVAASGSGVVTLNKIATFVKAFINGDGATGIQAKSATLSANDASSIKADAGAASLAIAGGGTTGVAVSIGVSVASNFISNEIEAFINNADNSLNTTTGLLSLTATTNATINALSVAASLAAGGGGTAGVNISGAGAAAINTILTKTNAYIQNSVVSSAGSVSLTATNSATISATIAAVSISAGGGGTAGVGVSIGAAVANNLIGYDGSTRQPAEVQAYIRNSSLTTAGDLTLNAFSNGSINAGVGAGSAAISGGGTAGVAASGSGVSTENRIATYVKAFIDGDRATGIQAKSATLTANDSSYIKADAGAASIAASFGGTAGVSVSIGVSLASNLISNEVAAFINGADNHLNTTTGNISLTAITNASIQALSIAASIAAGFGGTAGVAISGAGAEADNTILTKTNAYIAGSVVNSAGAVSLTATNSASISATIAAVSVSASGGGTAGVGVSIGAAVATNLIGYDQNGNRTPAEVQAYIQNSSVNATGDLTLSAVNSGTINAGVGAGSAAISGGGTAGVAGSGSGVSTVNKIATLIKAFVDGDGATGIQAKTATLSANDASSIKADAGAASIAASFGGTAGVSVSIGVSLASNLISNEVAAFINGADNHLNTTTGNVSLTAVTNASIQALSIAASIAAGFGGTAGVSISGAGAEADNTILTKTNAYIKGSVVNSAGAVSLTATNSASISATIAAVSVSASGGGTAGVGVSIGAAVATNLIGYDQNGNRIPAEVQAYIQNSSVNATGDLTLSAVNSGTINAGVGAGSAAISGGGTAGVAGSGSGVSTVNKIATLIQAFVDGDGATGIQAKTATFTANDASSIKADAGAASIAASFGGTAGVSVSIGVSLASNLISNEVAAFINGADNTLRTTTGNVSLTASTNASIQALSIAASIAASFGGTAGVSISGAGAEANNTILTKTNAYIAGSVVNSAGAVSLTAINSANISATIAAVSASVSGGGTAGVGVSIGAAVASNLIGYDQSGNSLPAQVQAYILNSSVNAIGDLSLTAIASENINAGVGAGSAAVSAGGTAGVSGSGSGVSTTNKIGSLIYAFINGDGPTGIQAKSVSLTANDASTIIANAGAASIAASFSGTASVSISIGVALAHNVVTNQVKAYIQNASHSVGATAGDVSLSATTNATISAVAVAASLAAGISGTAGIGVSGAGAESTNNISTKTNAYTQDSVINSSGAVNINAQNTAGISATIAAASVAVGVSGTAGVAASIGVAIARNEIGWGIDPNNTSHTYTTGSGEKSLNAGDRVLIAQEQAIFMNTLAKRHRLNYKVLTMATYRIGNR